MDLQGVFDVVFKDEEIIIIRVVHPYNSLNNYGRIIYSSDKYSIYLFQRNDENVEFAFPADNVQLAYSPFLGRIVYQDVF